MNAKPILFCVLLALPAWGQSVYKCPQPDGKVKYQSLPCPSGDSVSIVDSGKSTGATRSEVNESGLRPGEQAILDQAKQREDEQRKAAAQARREASASQQRMIEKQIQDFQRDVHCEFSPIPCHERRP